MESGLNSGIESCIYTCTRVHLRWALFFSVLHVVLSLGSHLSADWARVGTDRLGSELARRVGETVAKLIAATPFPSEQRTQKSESEIVVDGTFWKLSWGWRKAKIRA